MPESCQQKNPASGCPLDTPSLPFSSGRYSALSLLPAKGATAVLSAQGNMYRSFQSTHPRGVRLRTYAPCRKPATVSIHAPARGATQHAASARQIDTVSIHAPARGATGCFGFCFLFVRFQSTHPRGVRLLASSNRNSRTMFQSTHPRGVRLRLCQAR